MVVIIIPEGQSVGDLQTPDERYTTLTNFDQYSEDFCKEQQTSPKAYIAAEYGRYQVPVPPNNYFIVGYDDSSNPNSPNDQSKYTNGPLCYSVTYTFFFRAYPAVDTPVS